MKRVTRLIVTALLAAASLPALAANGSMSFWDELWSAITGTTSTSPQAADDVSDCSTNPHECSAGSQ